MVAPRRAGPWERYAWAGGIVFVVALVTETVISVAVKADQNDSAAKIATELHVHDQRLVVVACISILYGVGFVIYLARLLVRENTALAATP